MSGEFDSWSSQLFDKSLPAATRLEAAARLVTADPFKAKEILIKTAADASAEVDLLQGIGKELARCAGLTSHLTEWDFRDMTDVAHDAYWDALPE